VMTMVGDCITARVGDRPAPDLADGLAAPPGRP
jgi:hypothetical protein